MGLAPALMLLFSAGPPPTLCVRVEKGLSVDEPSLIAATRARIARRSVRVVRCRTLDSRATWRLSVARGGADAIMLRMVGEDVHAGKNLAIGGMTQEEVVQLISLTAVEAVRPSMEALLEKMGLDAAPPPEGALVAELEAQCAEPRKCPEPKVVTRTTTVTVQPPAQAGFLLVAGPMLGTSELEWSAFIELRGYVEVGGLVAALHTGVNLIPNASSADVDLGTFELELGVSASYRWSMFELGLRAQNRVSFVSPSGGSPDLANELQFFWNGGFGALFGLWLWESESWEVGASAQVWAWPQPNRFLVAGQIVRAQSYVEVLVGPMLRFRSGL